MAVAVLSTSAVSNPFQMAPQRVASQPPAASSSTLSTSPESSSKPFSRIRSSLEHTLRTATRSRTKPPPPDADDFALLSTHSSTRKGKEKAPAEDPPKEKEKGRSKMLKRLESKVTFRRDTPSPYPPAPPADKKDAPKPDKPDKVRRAGLSSFITPSLRQGSMSSPALHLSSQALPSPKSQSAVPASSSNLSAALVSPSRDRSRRASLQPQNREVSAPAPLMPKRDSRMNGHAPTNSNISSRHRATKSNPPAIPSSPSSPSLLFTNSALSDTLATPTRRSEDLPSPPDTPTPMPRGHSIRTSSKTAVLSSEASSPTTPTPRGSSPSPIRARSPSTRTSRVVSPSQRGLSSASATHLPLSSPSPSPTPRRPSIDGPRRPSVSISPPPTSRNVSPSSQVRPRPISPSQRSYAQNRHFNISTTSLSSPPNPEQRELIRTATSMLCKELVKPPAHVGRSENAMREWEEVEVRTRALARLERIWGKSGGVGANSSSNISTSGGGMTSSGLSAGGEEREKRLFCEALRDGFVLCQLMNKLRSSSIVRPDVKEDGFVRTSNVTKFLAACASYGLASEDLFQRDDLIEASGESLARVARTIIALIKFVETPAASRIKFIPGQGKKLVSSPPSSPTSPYSHGTSSRGASSTPNLSIAQMQPSTSPTPLSRKRYSPPSGLPTVRSNSPDEGSGNSSSGKTAQEDDTPPPLPPPPVTKEVPQIMIPPPRSPLRARSQRMKEDEGGLLHWAMGTLSRSASKLTDSPSSPISSSVGDRASLADSYIRQSMASSAVSDTTAFSSLLDVGRSSSNKYGTIRTVTTDVTSEAPSFTRTEGSSIAASLADEIGRKRGLDPGVKYPRDRRPSETPVIDLSRVAEETDESGSSSRGNRRKDKGKSKAAEQQRDVEKVDKSPPLRLGKGKWPDDFLDALQAHTSKSPSPAFTPSPDLDESPRVTPPLSISPPRKLAIVGASRRNESLESISQMPRRPSQRPTHRARHSIDTPVLMPKESILRRDASPDGMPTNSNRVVIRRQSTKPTGPQRNGVYIPRGSLDDARSSSNESSDVLVPFPRTTSGEHGSPSPRSSSGDDLNLHDKPRPPRGRFQSDVEGTSARRRGRPNSYDDLGAKPQRSRFESMVNLGVATGNASASDLLSPRNSLDGSAVRRTLILREEGKPPTHFQLGNCIGRGQFGSVYRALNLNTGQMVAVKRIRLEGLKEDEVTQLMKEVDLVKSLSHPSIVKYEGMARDEDTLSIVLEYAENGSLGQTLKAFGKLNERLVASYVVKILEGLHYLHQSEVVHCDLKAANILTTKNGNVKLSDFGVSLNLRAMEREIKDVAGTPNWMAPEVIELKGASTKSDIWSLACTVIELLTGRPPYADIANSMSVMFRIVEDDMPPLPDGCSPLLLDFLVQCFNKNPSKRPSAELLCEHAWLKKNWGAHKELRPQDSIPFLRRVSADLQKSEAVRYLSQIEMPDVPTLENHRSDDVISGSPPRHSNSSSRPLADNDISPREHTFVKTTFSKPMVCRVCLLNVKKSAVLCEQCSLIAHSKCAMNAPPTCDLRAQLLLYARYAEQGNPGSVYSNPVDILNGVPPTSAKSDVSYVAHTPRTSLDVPSTPSPIPGAPPIHPPTAFKFITAFKRSRSNLHQEATAPASSASLPQAVPQDDKEKLARKPTVLLRKERPRSLASSTTNADSSVRSAATAAESFTSRHATSVVNETSSHTTGGRLSAKGSDAGGHRSSRMTSTSISGASRVTSTSDDARSGIIPGEMPADSRRQAKHTHTRGTKSANCIVQ